MKKMMITGLVCVFIGVVLCGAAYAMNTNTGNADLSSDNISFLADGVSKINIGAGVAHIRILKGDVNSTDITIKAENIIVENFNCDLEDNTLKISYNPNSHKFGFVSLPKIGFINKEAQIDIYIPDGQIFDEFIFDCGVGKIETEQINAQSIIIKDGVGEYDIKNLIAGNLDITGGVGEIKINGVINGNTKIDCGVGSVKLSGQANGDIKIKGGVGEIKLDLTGNVDDYNIKAEHGIGSIHLNGGKIPKSTQANGKYKIDIDAGVGSIDVNIK